MSQWEIVGAIVGVLSFLLAVLAYWKSRSDSITEAAKLEIYRERMRNLHSNLMSIMYSVDAVVQLAKQDSASIELLQNLARLARGQLYTTAEQVKRERDDLETWRFGKMVESRGEIDIESPKQHE